MNTPTLYALEIDVPSSLADAVSSRLFDAGLRGIEEQPAGARIRLVLYGEDRLQVEYYAMVARDYLAALAQFTPEAHTARVEIHDHENANWSTAWQKFFRPTPLTDKLLVQPPWEANEPPPGMTALVIEPKMAFGVGTHATTRLAARSVERYCRAHPGCRVFDFGTGTGILALVAIKCGAASAVGTDLDPVAVDTARENALRNGCAAQTEFWTRELTAFAAPFEMVVANVTTPVLAEVAPELARLTAPGGLLALTGVLAEDGARLAAEYAEHGLELVRREEEDEWCLLEVAKE